MDLGSCRVAGFPVSGVEIPESVISCVM